MERFSTRVKITLAVFAGVIFVFTVSGVELFVVKCYNNCKIGFFTQR